MDGWKKAAEECKAKKASWPRGEWDNEPDYVEFKSSNRVCYLVRNSSTGSWCGYVSVPDSHWLFEKNKKEEYYIECNLEVHGGVTWARDGLIGFDAAHHGDLMPAMSGLPSSGGVYRNLEYVKAETVKLAKQIGAPNSIDFMAKEKKDE